MLHFESTYSGQMISMRSFNLFESIRCPTERVDLLVGVTHKHLGNLLFSQNINDSCRYASIILQLAKFTCVLFGGTVYA